MKQKEKKTNRPLSQIRFDLENRDVSYRVGYFNILMNTVSPRVFSDVCVQACVCWKLRNVFRWDLIMNMYVSGANIV